MPALSLLLTAALSCAPATHPIVAEVYYDAPGVDTGYEFVEIWNTGDAPASLAGLRLEAGDGAGPGRWTLRWTGGPADSIRAHARFVVGGALVVPAADRVVTLDLQNGPDAMRLVWPDGTSEVVGWGAHDFPEYYCGAPAPDVAGGQSLARIPDAAATGSNAGDFHPAEPSPGVANVRARDAALVRHRLALDPGAARPGRQRHADVAAHQPGRERVAGERGAPRGERRPDRRAGGRAPRRRWPRARRHR